MTKKETEKEQKTTKIPENLAPPENYNFVQIKDQYLRSMQQMIAESPVSAQVLFFFIEKMGKLNNSVVCSYTTLCEVTGYSRSTIARSIKYLKDRNWISTVKVGSATAYCVNAQVAWRSANNQRHYAVFSSTVVASSSEQGKDFKATDRKLRNIPIEIFQDVSEAYRKEMAEILANAPPDDLDEPYEPEEPSDEQIEEFYQQIRSGSIC